MLGSTGENGGRGRLLSAGGEGVCDITHPNASQHTCENEVLDHASGLPACFGSAAPMMHGCLGVYACSAIVITTRFCGGGVISWIWSVISHACEITSEV